MQWFGAFALLVTLVWLYTEIVNLLGKLQGASLIRASVSGGLRIHVHCVSATEESAP